MIVDSVHMKIIYIFCYICLSIGLPGLEASDKPDERKTLIVTGSTGELGGAAAKLLAKDCNLILTGRNSVKLKDLQTELNLLNTGVYQIHALDYTDASSRNEFYKFLKQQNTQVDGIALIVPRPQFNSKSMIQPETVWLDVLKETFTGPSEVLSGTLPYLSQIAKIVVIAGTTSVQLQPEFGPSCVIRRMWTTYTKALSHQLGSKGISVNTLSPGIVLTNYHLDKIECRAKSNGLCLKDQMKEEVDKIPLKRHAKPIEIAQTIKFLLSDDSNFISGINLVIDGGLNTCY